MAAKSRSRRRPRARCRSRHESQATQPTTAVWTAAVLEAVDHAVWISEQELSYQLGRRHLGDDDLSEQMLDLQQRGLIQTSLYFQLTKAGQEQRATGRSDPDVSGPQDGQRG